ncbi:MAG: alpha/beta hydrolase [Planctomycetota bacterium]
MTPRNVIAQDNVVVQSGPVGLPGQLTIPPDARGLVIFAHGSGSGRFSSRNRFVADELHDGGLGTLLFDLLTAEESEIDEQTTHLRFDIQLLSDRLIGAVDWAAGAPALRALPIGLFGASTGAAAALFAAADRAALVRAVVSRGGRPDLAAPALPYVEAPTLLIVGGLDEPVLSMNWEASRMLKCPWQVEIVPDATHLFEEPGALARVAELAREWFQRYLPGGAEGPRDHGVK